MRSSPHHPLLPFESPMEKQPSPKSCTPSAPDLLLTVLIIFALVFILGVPRWQKMMQSPASPEVSIPVGTVQRIRFIGNLGIDTQIDTEERSFLVRGISKLHRGTPLHLYRGTWNSALCNADASICEWVRGVD